MMNRAIRTVLQKQIPIFAFSSRNGPYNPNKFNPMLTPKDYPTNKEIEELSNTFASAPPQPLRNTRHINPVRQSGPLPVYDGPHTMEDIRNIWFNTTCGRQGSYSCQMDPEEIMRRVPGITRKEAEFITTLGFSPDEQVDFAYLVYHMGLDVFYQPNQVFVARQVVTNSKGEKVEILFNCQSSEDLALLNVGFAPIKETVDYHWEIFLWADPMIKVTGELDLGVPNTWFEYESEWLGEMVGIEDQFPLPEDIRPYPSPRNPNCRKELWRSQDDIQEQKDMEDENWFPKQTAQNIYQRKGHITKKLESTITEDIKI